MKGNMGFETYRDANGIAYPVAFYWRWTENPVHVNLDPPFKLYYYDNNGYVTLDTIFSIRDNGKYCTAAIGQDNKNSEQDLRYFNVFNPNYTIIGKTLNKSYYNNGSSFSFFPMFSVNDG